MFLPEQFSKKKFIADVAYVIEYLILWTVCVDLCKVRLLQSFNHPAKIIAYHKETFFVEKLRESRRVSQVH